MLHGGDAPGLVDSGQRQQEGTSVRRTAEFGVLRFVDHTHPATAELLDDAIVRNGLANHAGSAQR